ncbi:MAG: hypothetical protein WC391_05650 [Methanoregula sp.]|jgi:hypothetical protein
MKPPRIHPMLFTIVNVALSAADGVVFTDHSACPACGGTSLAGYDTKKKQFAVLREGTATRTLYVYVKRFYCRDCHTLCYADEPFYPKTRMGSPVVDLAITLFAEMPPNRVASYAAAMGIILDRTTCRLYAKKEFPHVPTTDLFGIRIPVSVFTLSTLATTAGEGSSIMGAEILAACGFPSAYRAPLHLPAGTKKGDEGDEQEYKEKRHVDKPHDAGDNDRPGKEDDACLP